MLRRAVRVAKVKITQINRQWHRRTQNAHGVSLVKGEIAEHQQTPQGAAFPEAEWNDAFSSPLRGNPLNEKAEPKDETAGQAHNFPRVNRKSKDVGLGEKQETVHKGQRFRQIVEGDQLFSTRSDRRTLGFAHVQTGLELRARQVKEFHA